MKDEKLEMEIKEALLECYQKHPSGNLKAVVIKQMLRGAEIVAKVGTIDDLRDFANRLADA